MSINKRKIVIYLVIFYIAVLSLISVSYFFYTNNYFDSFAFNYAKQNQEQYSSELNILIKDEYDYYIANNPKSKVIANGVITDNLITYENVTINMEANNLNIYNLAIRDKYLFLLKENSNEYGVINVDELIDQVILSTKATTIMLMDSTGHIYYNKNDTERTLTSYLDSNTNDYIQKYFSKNISDVLKDKRNGEDIFLSFHTLDNYKNLYLMESFLRKDIRPMYYQYDMMFIIGLVFYTTIMIGIQIYIFKTIHIKNAEIESSKVRYLYTKPYIIKINFKGKIKRINKRVKDKIIDINNYSNINELSVADFDSQISMMDIILRQAPLTIAFEEKRIRFIPLKYTFGYHLVGEDVTDRQVNIEEMRMLAYYDKVTMQPNESYFKSDLSMFISSMDYDYKKATAVIFDISGFNFMNKVFGKQTCDVILYRLGKLLKDEAQNYKGIVYNTEEDKFVVFFSNNKDKVEKFVKHIFELVKKPVQIEQNNINVILNAGIYYFEESDTDENAPKRIYDALMVALNKSKESSLYSYIVYDDVLKVNVSKINIMTKDLINAIKKEEEITVYLQPQYDNHKKLIVGFEALVRWDNPNYINVSPQVYIEIAENNNLIIPMGQLIMKQTFILAQKLKEYDVAISMNVSPVQILQDGFVDDFLKLYKSYNLKDGSIAVEVTETFLITSLRVVNEKLKILKANGISIHLDDFGTGYSSLPYLRELSIDTVKIDREFIRYLETDKKDRTIVKMLINLVNSLELEIIAEGVEDDYQNNYLYKNGCDIIQGYIISPAVPFEKALELLQQYNVDKTKKLKVQERRQGRL